MNLTKSPDFNFSRISSQSNCFRYRVKIWTRWSLQRRTKFMMMTPCYHQEEE